MAIPTFFVVGAYKSGTTALYSLLRQHPRIYLNPFIKESNYFSLDVPNGYRVESWEAYQQLFTNALDDQVIGEVCPSYLFSMEAAKRISEVAPTSKIIAIFRDPTKRAISDYLMLVRDGFRRWEDLHNLVNREINGRLQPGEQGILSQSRYIEQIERYRYLFPTASILLLSFDEFCSHPEQVMNRIFAFLGLPSIPLRNSSDTYNVSGIPKLMWLQQIFSIVRRRRRMLKRFIPAPIAVVLMKLANRNLDHPQVSPAIQRALDDLFTAERDWVASLWLPTRSAEAQSDRLRP